MTKSATGYTPATHNYSIYSIKSSLLELSTPRESTKKLKSRKKEQFFDVIVDSLQSVTGHDFIEHPQLNVRQSFVVRITKEKCDKMRCWVYPSNNVGLLYLVYWGGGPTTLMYVTTSI